MPSLLRIVFAAILTVIVSAAPAAEPIRVPNLDEFCEEVLSEISNNEFGKAADFVAKTAGQPDSSNTVAGAFKIFEGKHFDFTRKVIDRDFNGSLRQIVHYSYVEKLGFVYFRFNFKMTSTGWVLANFTFKGETQELFPKDFIER
jgi:opacity protein-like surface antigen